MTLTLSLDALKIQCISIKIKEKDTRTYSSSSLIHTKKEVDQQFKYTSRQIPYLSASGAATIFLEGLPRGAELYNHQN
jgi:hypothetical protein